jgi:hypothetical protein
MPELQDHEDFLPDFKEKLEGPDNVWQAALEKTAKVCVKVSQRCNRDPQEVETCRNLECLPRKATGSRQSQPKREAMWATNSKIIGWDCPTPWLLLTPPHVLDPEDVATGCHVYPARFQTCLGFICYINPHCFILK